MESCPKSCGFCGLMTAAPVTPKTYTMTPVPVTREPVTQAPLRKCGKSMAQTSRIISGTKAVKDQWPWQVSIYYKRNFLCGGSIISPNWIITAAHCVDGFDYRYYQIVLGDYDRRDVDGDEKVFYALQAFHHPQWMRPSQLNHDVALIQLNKPATFNNHIQPICLPERDEVPAVGSTCYVSGWGQSVVGRGGPPTQILKQAKLQIVSNRECYDLNTYNLRIKVTNQMVCAGYGPYSSNKNSGCHGDSGGPFVCEGNDGRWVLQGSVSWGSGYCDTREAYSVFARMTELRDWVIQNIS